MADEKNGSSDLDIFDGLGKKAPSIAPPAPPPAAVPAAPPNPKHTLLGIPTPGSLPVAPPSSVSPATVPANVAPASAPATTPGSNLPPPPAATNLAPRSAPPPPPGRSNLPSAPAPAPKSNPPPLPPEVAAQAQNPGTARSAAPPAPPTAPQNGAKLQMDWDDDDEATHVFDKDTDEAATAKDAGPVHTAPMGTPASVRPPPVGAPSAPPPPPPASSRMPATAPLGGAVSAPPPPPPPASTRMQSAPPLANGGTLMSASAPPPPPPGSGRMQAAPPASVPPPRNPLQPPLPSIPPPSIPPGTAPMGPAPAPVQPPVNPTLASGKSVPPPQVTTAPLPLPSRPPSVPPPGVPQTSRAMEQTAMVRPQPESRNWAMVAVALLGAAAVAGGAVFLMMPRTGSISINVTDTKGGGLDKVTVYVDGKEECGTTPCVVKRESGSHVIKVTATGFETPETKTVTVDNGKEASVSFLVSKSGASATGVRTSSATPGLKLFVDDELIGTLPQEVKTLTPGDHKIKITGGERYASLEKTITVAKGEVIDLNNVALKVLRGKATIDSQAPGAKVYLVSGSDRRELPKLPLPIEIDTSKSWVLEATQPGKPDFKQPITFEDGQAEKSFMVTFDTKAAMPATNPPVVAPGPVAPPPGPATPAPAPKPPTETAPKPAPAETGGTATLNINSIPGSNVVLDGKPIGPTPKMGVSVSAGSHTVKFINSEQGLSKSVSVSVKGGDTKTVAAKLKD